MRATTLATAVFALSLCATSRAQLSVEREYFGVGRPVAVRVNIPEDLRGEARINLMEAGAAEPIAGAPVIAGQANLASLIPRLWTDKSPKVRYAQLIVGETPVGPPLVLVPMINPPIAKLFDATAGLVWMIDPATGKPNDADPRRATVLFTPDEAPCYTGLRIYRDQHAVLVTSLGDIEFRLRPDEAPNTVATFRSLASGGFYTDVIFHRVAAVTRTGDPFVVQVGDPSGTGDGGPGFNIDLEDSKLPHDFGVLSMARNTDPNTNGSQVFICLSRAGTSRLDGRYTAFAQAVSGAEVILALAASPVREGTDRPVEPPTLQTVKLIDAPPYGQAPPAVSRPSPDEGRR